MKEQKKFFWDDHPETGDYYFCHGVMPGGIYDYNFYIEEVDVKYAHKDAAQRFLRFRAAKFVWGGSYDKTGYGDHPLAADNIEDAKREFEAWYQQLLENHMARLKGTLAAVEENYNRFRQYQKEA